MKEKINEILSKYSELKEQDKNKLVDELSSFFTDIFETLPDEFYDMFVRRQINDCGGEMFKNIDAQYHYARGFYATIDILKEIYNK